MEPPSFGVIEHKSSRSALRPLMGPVRNDMEDTKHKLSILSLKL